MERKEVEIEEEDLKFEQKMVTPQRFVMGEDWKSFKEFFVDEGYRALMESFDLAQNTAIHVAVSSEDPRLLTELLEMLPVKDRWPALRARNLNQWTVLHSAIKCSNVKVVDVILKYEKELPALPDEEIDEPKEKHRPLVELKNDHGETPLFAAVKMGTPKMVKHLAQHVTDLQMHSSRDDGTSILHAAIMSQIFDVAIWLMEQDKRLAKKKDGEGQRCLQLLSKMPFVFLSGSESSEYYDMGTMEKLIYFRIILSSPSAFFF